MFVQANTLGDIYHYFQDKLSHKFSINEIKLMVKEMAIKRLNISEYSSLIKNDVKLSESDLLYYRSVLKRLENDEPFAYILGYKYFSELNIPVDRRALIPRPETEELVNWVIKSEAFKNNQTVLDLCAGSGCISFALKSAFPNVNVRAVEYSEDAIDLLLSSKQSLNIDIEVVHADVLSDTIQSLWDPGSVSCIVANPPYVLESDRMKMTRNVLDFEPEMALFVQDDSPFTFYEAIARHANVLLQPGGSVYFEIHEDLTHDLVSLLNSLSLVNIEVRKDLQGKDRMIMAKV